MPGHEADVGSPHPEDGGDEADKLGVGLAVARRGGQSHSYDALGVDGDNGAGGAAGDGGHRDAVNGGFGDCGCGGAAVVVPAALGLFTHKAGGGRILRYAPVGQPNSPIMWDVHSRFRVSGSSK